MATMERPRSRPAVTTATLTREADDYMKRAAKLQENQQHDEAAVLYRRVVSLINAHEDTATVDDNLKAMKRHANQLLLQSTVRRNHATSSDAAYQNMVRQLSMHTAEADEDQDAAAASAEAGQNPPAYEAVATEADLADSSASVVFQLDTGAKIFYLAKDGSIQTTSETLPLTIFQAADDGENCGLLKLGSWIYPLHPKVSPAFKTGYDAYIFPNNTSIGEFVGLMFDESVTPDVRHYFEDTLSGYSVFMAQEGTPTYGAAITPGTKNNSAKHDEIIGHDVAAAQRLANYDTNSKTGKLAATLMTGTNFVTKQLATGVGMAENLIGNTSKTIHQKIVPNPEPVKIPRGVQMTARGLRSTSEVAVKASGFVVNTIGSMTMGLARTFAPSFGKSKKIVQPDGTVYKPKMSGVKGIGHAGFTSFGILYESCENAAKHLATNLANESVGVVRYKYGEDASVLTENAAYAVGNTALTAYHVQGLGPKSIAKKVVTETAKQTAKNAFT